MMATPKQTPATVEAESEWMALLKDAARSGGQGRPPARLRWQLRVARAIRSAPILRNGSLYVAAVDGNLHAIEAASARTKWKFQAPGQIHATPSFSGNAILLGCDDGKVYAIDSQ